jgi:hypothetical protein
MQGDICPVVTGHLNGWVESDIFDSRGGFVGVSR